MSVKDIAETELDSSNRRSELNPVTRFMLLILLALSLASGSSPAFAGRSGDCRMTGATHQMPMDHEKMGCCTPDCAVTCPPAMLPVSDMDMDQPPASATLPVMALAEAFHSLNPAAIDPPPRTSFS